MLHLSTDRLAALGDDHPTPAALAHLPPCPQSARQRAAGPSTTQGLAPDPVFGSGDAARVAQARSEQLYQQAAAFLAQHDSSSVGDGPVAVRSRLAYVDRVLSATRQAMREAPHDPVINGY